MWIISQNYRSITNGKVEIYISWFLDKNDQDIYKLQISTIDSEESCCLGTFSSIENCQIVLKLIIDAAKNNLSDFKIPTNEQVEKVKNDKKA